MSVAIHALVLLYPACYASTMSTRPNRVAQTSTEVRKLYKRNGGGIPERQQRQLERAADLEKRAQGLREREERNRANKKKREEKERKDAALRRINGVGLATQLAGYSHTQAQLKRGMEAFIGYNKNRKLEQQKKELEVAKKLEAIVEAEVSKEPWDEDDTFDIPNPPTRAEDQFDDDLDDETLLELHDSILSDPVEERTDAPKPVPVASLAPVPRSSSVEPSQGDTNFVRLHGPINKVVDSILEKLSDPLVELLSHDHSTDCTTWDPSPALLYKLNPPSVPPHRLRIKVGCVVTLLRDLNSSSQLSKSQHLQILRIEQERLECLVLDGQLEGTKTFLTKVPFIVKYRNEAKCPYQRIQFPIQVSQNYVVPPINRRVSQSRFKKLTPTGQIAQQSNSSVKRSVSLPKKAPQFKRNPSFKLPGLPASKSMTAIATKSMPSPPTPFLDGWDDFLDTATQIARDLSSEPIKAPLQKTGASASPIQPPKEPSFPVNASAPPLSTQDFDFSLEDLDISPVLPKAEPQTTTPQLESEISHSCQGQTLKTFPRTWEPAKKDAISAVQPPKPRVTSMKPPHTPALKRKFTESPHNGTTSTFKRHQSNAIPTGLNLGSASDPGNSAFQNSITKKATNNAGSKRPTTPLAMRMPSFSDFGISTQEAASFFGDDDELAFGSPPIAV